jgi:copper chaperone CopZ
MSQYIHHVPGRIRVRSKAFRCAAEKARRVEAKLHAIAGVRQVRVNPHAGSVIIHYDTAVLSRVDLLALMEQSGCLAASGRNGQVAGKVGEMFGKALVVAVMEKAVQQSARSLIGALI